MIKKLHKLIASSISTIDYPKISKFHTWLNIPIIEEKSNLINRSNKSTSFNFKLHRTTLVTENICLKMYRSRFVSSIVIKKNLQEKTLYLMVLNFNKKHIQYCFLKYFF